MQAFHGLQTFSIYSTVKLPILGVSLFLCDKAGERPPCLHGRPFDKKAEKWLTNTPTGYIV